jgi:hypothetical protein
VRQRRPRRKRGVCRRCVCGPLRTTSHISLSLSRSRSWVWAHLAKGVIELNAVLRGAAFGAADGQYAARGTPAHTARGHARVDEDGLCVRVRERGKNKSRYRRTCVVRVAHELHAAVVVCDGQVGCLVVAERVNARVPAAVSDTRREKEGEVDA